MTQTCESDQGPKTGPFFRSLFGTVFAVGLKLCARSLSVDAINVMSNNAHEENLLMNNDNVDQ